MPRKPAPERLTADREVIGCSRVGDFPVLFNRGIERLRSRASALSFGLRGREDEIKEVRCRHPAPDVGTPLIDFFKQGGLPSESTNLHTVPRHTQGTARSGACSCWRNSQARCA